MVDMTTAASGLYGLNPDTTELSSAADAALRMADECLRDGPIGQVGLEIEAHCFDLSDPMARPTWERLTDVIAAVPPLPGGSAITVEPGGAVELSGPPCDGPGSAIAAMRLDRALLSSAFTQHGLGLVLLGADPLRPAKRINPGARYRAMEQFFEASGTADAGAAMMTSTASVQVNVDAGPRDGWARTDDDRDLGQFAAAPRKVRRLAQHATARVEPTRLGPLRPHPRCQRRRSGQ
jgi:glutamate--cysteine ligase